MKGKEKLYSLIIIILLIVGGSAYFFSRGLNNTVFQTEIVPSPTLVPTVTPIRWLNYQDVDIPVSLSYPSSHTLQNSLIAINRLKAEKQIEFVPTDKSKLETDLISLTVFSNGQSYKSSQWVKSNVTSKQKENAQLSGKTYTYFDATEIKDATVSGKPASTFIQTFPDTSYKSYSTVIASNKYVYVFTHTEGFVEDIYQKMLSSLTIASQ